MLAMKGEEQVYAVSSSTREHTSISLTVNAAGELVAPQVIFSGVRDLTKTKMNLPKDDITGEWQYSYTINGWVKQNTYLDIIKDSLIYI